MNGFYTITESIKSTLVDKGFRVVTIGDNYKVDIQRQTIFPYAHIIPESTDIEDNITHWNFTIIGMDLLDINKSDLRDQAEPFYSTDNLQDILNDIHNRLSEFVVYYQRGAGSASLLKMVQTDSVSMEAFLHRYENILAGWSLSITITAPTNISKC